jgi:hypothetical protein
VELAAGPLTSPVILLESALDYAGLFPPAGLTMAEAVTRYAAYRRAPASDRMLLGRFVVTAGRLDELLAAVRALQKSEAFWPWELSVLSAGDAETDRDRIADFAKRSGMMVASIERRVERASEVASVAGAFGKGWKLYLEVAADSRMRETIGAVAAAGACAKVRTGGVTADAFPSTDQLARFMLACAAENVAFKATAGLHHAVRSDYRVTYERDAPCATMHGFLNLFVGAALLDAGRVSEAELGAVLEEREQSAFRVGMGSVAWRDRSVTATEVGRMRTRLLHSFGTCSFEEPVAELRALGALP